MKLLRFFYYAAMPIMFLFGMYTGLILFYVIFFTQLLLLVVVVFIDIWTVKTFRYTQKLGQESAVKGGETTLYIKIMNEKPIPLSLMEISVDVVSVCENIKLTFSLAPFSEKEFEIPVSMPYRGNYLVGMTVMRITDIFGLMTLRFDMRKQTYYRMVRLLVYPKAESLDNIAARIWDTKLFGSFYLKQAEQGDSVSGMRSYRPGDPLKRVHWKNSAKHGELYVKQYEVAMRKEALIILDSGTKGLEGEDALFYADTMCQCAASIALYNLSRGRRIHAAAPSVAQTIAECRSDTDFDPIHKWLALLNYNHEDRLLPVLETLTEKTDDSYSLFILTRRPSEDLIRKLLSLQEIMESVTLILVDDEITQNDTLHILHVNTGDDLVLRLGNFA
ncbi:MAG: DUF58 domain-containing protein [Clostridiales bacterium]|nr:DUF58 domain-containing protein [Clostridiales bacterium]